jgi:hypothetical protein
MSLRAPIKRQSWDVDGVYDITDARRLRTKPLYIHRIRDARHCSYRMQAGSIAAPMAANSVSTRTVHLVPGGVVHRSNRASPAVT